MSLLAIVAVGGLIAVLLFQVSLLAVVIGAAVLLCPLLHLGGGHGHGGHREMGEEQRQG